ncbi:MAG: hypothetical protein JNM42_14320 [Propionivibrio sp.]|uniref:hypothetical protein n=1 Tax=Propionivibrio sp. TaxID=2212460 RepID=UPI001A37DF55|nr:hypothetical protein [Propionivibrio sp.]MBL8415611.1 hypothetical protein [Propionivibrio sp.]
MLLSWLDRLTLFVHPHRVLLDRQPWRGTASRQQADVDLPAAGESDWQPALTAAGALLKAHGRRGAALRIVIADHFVRYALLPWSEDIIGNKARLALALALLKNSMGDRVKALEIALDRPAFGKNGIAAGVDRQLLAGLRASAQEHRLRLDSLQVRLIAELAARHKQMEDGWFACIDREWLTLVGLRRGEIGCLHNHRASTGDAALLVVELAGLLAAERAAVEGRNLFISSRDVAIPSLVGDWETTRWPASVGADLHA